MSTETGWPAHRPNCDQRDMAVATTVTRVAGRAWTIRRCGECGQVALVPVVSDSAHVRGLLATEPVGGDAA